MPLHVSNTCAPDDEHMYSKHVEAWNKLTVKHNFVHHVGLITKIKKPSLLVRISLCFDTWTIYVSEIKSFLNF